MENKNLELNAPTDFDEFRRYRETEKNEQFFREIRADAILAGPVILSCENGERITLRD